MSVKSPQKRFYKKVELYQSDSFYGLLLDQEKLKTPKGRFLLLPTEKIALAIHAEWDSQGEILSRDLMPVTQLANTALDKIDHNKEQILTQLCIFAHTDLLCYRVQKPQDLVTLQNQQWSPLLDWLSQQLGSPFTITDRLEPLQQPDSLLKALRLHLESFTLWQMTAFQSATTTLGSICLAFAFLYEKKTIEDLIDLSRLEALYQEKFWGQDQDTPAYLSKLTEELLASQILIM